MYGIKKTVTNHIHERLLSSTSINESYRVILRSQKFQSTILNIVQTLTSLHFERKSADVMFASSRWCRAIVKNESVDDSNSHT